MEFSPRLIEQLFDASLRVVLLEAFRARSTDYDSGWRVLPFAMVAEFRQSTVQLERAETRTHTIAPGEAVVIPAGVPHRFRYLRGNRTYTRYVHIHFLLSESIDLLTLLEIPPIVPLPVSEHLGEICESLAQLHTSLNGSFYLPELVQKKALEFRLLEEIVTVAPLKDTGPAFLSQVQRLAPVLNYIERHLATPLSRDHLASLMHLSPRHFDAVFKKTMSLNPQEYIKRLRIRRAQELLLQSDDAVAEIASSVGYRDAFHFSRQFRAVCGVSPTHYRQQIRSSLITE